MLFLYFFSTISPSPLPKKLINSFNFEKEELGISQKHYYNLSTKKKKKIHCF